MFGFEALPEIMAVAAVAAQCGAEAVSIPRSACGLTLDALAQGQRTQSAAAQPVGKMLVFCGLAPELDDLLAALRQRRIVCPKAVLTPANRNWTPGRLYRELEQERRAMGG